MGFGQQLSDFFFGSQPKVQQASLFNNQQQGVQNQGLQLLMQLLGGGQGGAGGQGGGQNQLFQPIANKATTEFNTQTIPGLAERFTALGGQNSSAFQGALGQAGAGLQENLAAQGSQQNNQLIQLLSQLGLAPQHENLVFQGQPGLFQTAAHGVGQGLGLYASGGLGGAAGAAGAVKP
jgi:hypothetical protein